jgi:hypothetical protein
VWGQGEEEREVSFGMDKEESGKAYWRRCSWINISKMNQSMWQNC